MADGEAGMPGAEAGAADRQTGTAGGAAGTASGGDGRERARGPVVRLRPLAGTYAVSRLAADAPFPAWADGAGFVSLSRTASELSIVCLAARVPADVRSDGEWRCLELCGPFAFDETGIVASVVAPLSAGGLGVFVVSTFDGDHLMVKAATFDRACALLAAAGHRFIGDERGAGATTSEAPHPP